MIILHIELKSSIEIDANNILLNLKSLYVVVQKYWYWGKLRMKKDIGGCNLPYLHLEK